MPRSTRGIQAGRCWTGMVMWSASSLGSLIPRKTLFLLALDSQCRSGPRSTQWAPRHINSQRRWQMDQNVNSENKLLMERMLYEVKKVIVGQDHLLERLIVA